MKLQQMESKISEYRKFKREAEEMQAVADSIAAELKAQMESEGLTSAVVGEYKLSYTDAKRDTLDKKRLEADLGDLTEYTKTTNYKIFRVA